MAGARHFTELVVWQLADQIRTTVYRLTERPVFVRDTRLRVQTDDAIESVCRNIAEGFGCESHAEFHRYLVIARRSLNELFDSLHAATRVPATAMPTIVPEIARRSCPESVRSVSRRR